MSRIISILKNRYNKEYVKYVCFHDEIFLDAHTISNLKAVEEKGVCVYMSKMNDDMYTL